MLYSFYYFIWTFFSFILQTTTGGKITLMSDTIPQTVHCYHATTLDAKRWTKYRKKLWDIKVYYANFCRVVLWSVGPKISERHICSKHDNWESCHLKDIRTTWNLVILLVHCRVIMHETRVRMCKYMIMKTSTTLAFFISAGKLLQC